jgi:hypothetical protein
VCEFELEGLDRPYQAGRSKHWVKVKNRKQASRNQPRRRMVAVNRRYGSELQLQVGRACLMFFVDETGHENIRRPKLSGIWLGRLRDQQSARFAVTMSKSVKLPPGMTPFDCAALSLANRFQDLLRRVLPEPNEVALLHEVSDRCDQLIARVFGRTVVQINHKQVPVHKALIRKAHGMPELDVADFVMHAAGRRAANLHRDPTARVGKDFGAIFYSNPVLCSYIHVTECVAKDGVFGVKYDDTRKTRR